MCPIKFDPEDFQAVGKHERHAMERVELQLVYYVFGNYELPETEEELQKVRALIARTLEEHLSDFEAGEMSSLEQRLPEELERRIREDTSLRPRGIYGDPDEEASASVYEEDPESLSSDSRNAVEFLRLMRQGLRE